MARREPAEQPTGRHQDTARSGATDESRYAPSDGPIRIGISTCLLGEKVRFDGGHKRDSFLTDMLGRYVEWTAVCPEVEVGMGIPREPVRLVQHGEDTRLITTRTGMDHTAAMRRYAAGRVAALAKDDLCGYVLKKNSPTCGMERVKVYGQKGSVLPTPGRGLFADALLKAFPHLPVEEEGRLCNPRIRENFIERVFAYRRLRNLFASRWTIGDLVTFHAAHKMQLLAHSRPALDVLGRLVASAKTVPRAHLSERYASEFMNALSVTATPKRQANVLQHMAGFLRNGLDANSRRELAELIDDYRLGLVPVVVPITLVRHHVRRLQVTYLQGQTYLDPHPKELMLRNHV